MEANELMIGDWVHCYGKPTKIAILTNGKVIGTEIGDGVITPIPLTAEILEKNGFEKYGLPYEWRDKVWVQRWHHTSFEIIFDINDTQEYDGFTWKGIEIYDGTPCGVKED